MTIAQQANVEQTAAWNGVAGRTWVEAQESLDRLFAPFETIMVDAVAARGARRVLDVGCGTGSTTLAIARQVGASGRAVGVDISGPMIALARTRAETERTSATFVRADAQTHEFAPASFDLIVSRFGVMFFDDPVRAFANLRRAAAPGAEVALIAWRSAEDNAFMTAAERAAAPLLPNLPARKPNEPGQFGFGDPDNVRAILEHSGWAEIDIQPLDVACVLPERDLVAYLTRLGPVGRMLQESAERTRVAVLERVRAAFDSYVHGDEVRFTAACWMIRARAAA